MVRHVRTSRSPLIAAPVPLHRVCFISRTGRVAGGPPDCAFLTIGGRGDDAWTTLVCNWLCSLMVYGMLLGLSECWPARTVVTPEPAFPGRSTVTRTVAAADGTVRWRRPRQSPWVDRHPLFSKPRDYWDTSGDNKIVKAAAATFVGVPVGMYGEVKQIIVGAPPGSPRY